jgi:hypothetical protein
MTVGVFYLVLTSKVFSPANALFQINHQKSLRRKSLSLSHSPQIFLLRDFSQEEERRLNRITQNFHNYSLISIDCITQKGSLFLGLVSNLCLGISIESKVNNRPANGDGYLMRDGGAICRWPTLTTATRQQLNMKICKERDERYFCAEIPLPR